MPASEKIILEQELVELANVDMYFLDPPECPACCSSSVRQLEEDYYICDDCGCESEFIDNT